MSGRIEVTLQKLILPIVGMGKVDIVVDGAHVLSLALGETGSTDVAAGKHVVQAIINGVIKRESNRIQLIVAENSVAKVRGIYSRMWGNMKLQSS